MYTTNMYQKFITEFFGTLLLVFILLTTKSPLAVGATFALILLLSSGSSKGYFNPAITIVLSSIGMISKTDVLPYCLSQILGAMVGLQLFKFTKQ